MRVQVDDRPLMESTRTSSTARSAAASGYLFFHRSRPARAASLSGEFATVRSGIFARAGGLGARRRHARRFTLHLSKVRRPGRVRQARGFIFVCKFQQSLQRTGLGVHTCVRIADFCEALRHREDGKIGRIAVGNFMPVKRRGDASVRERAHRIRRAGGPILRVLVVVEENAVALLFPPFRTGQRGDAALDRTRQRHRRAAHFGEGPARLDSHVDVHAA